MADVNTGLLQTLDGPGPQFKDAKNPDTMKWHEGDKAPYMQIVDTAGNPISSTNKMPVDVDGQSINVGNTVSTQLTGSNLQDADALPVRTLGAYVDRVTIATNFTIAAGAGTYVPSAITHDANATEISVSVNVKDQVNHPVTLQVQGDVDGLVGGGGIKVAISETTGNYRLISDRTLPVSLGMYIYVKNEDTASQHTYDIFMNKFYNSKGWANK